jgi:hypothetical protein
MVCGLDYYHLLLGGVGGGVVVAVVRRRKRSGRKSHQNTKVCSAETSKYIFWLQMIVYARIQAHKQIHTRFVVSVAVDVGRFVSIVLVEPITHITFFQTQALRVTIFYHRTVVQYRIGWCWCNEIQRLVSTVSITSGFRMEAKCHDRRRPHSPATRCSLVQ